MLGQMNPYNETGSVSDTLKPYAQKVAGWFLPTVTTTLALPIVPDGTVQGARYIPPNTTVDVVGNAQSLATSTKRLAITAAAGGAVVGGLAVWLLKR
jgi:hypothetical protein